MIDTMKIFLDTADVDTIQKVYSTGLIDGITTNPTLIMKSGEIPDKVYYELKQLGIKDISMEVVADTAKGMLEEASRLIGLFGDCVTIKVPCTPEGLLACREMAKQNIRVNVTLIFSPSQAILAAKAGATYVSPFVGRVDDNSFGGLCLIKDIAKIYQQQSWFSTEILAASIRNVRDVGRAFEYGANICTIPPNVFNGMYKHILTDKGLELFDEAWAKVCDESTTVT
jgi:transaldolase